MKIGLLSDTHSHMDDQILKHFKECDEIWHAGDIGDRKIMEPLQEIAPVVAVYGNIDDASLRIEFPEDQIFVRNKHKIYMTHIGGYPGRYKSRAKLIIQEERPQIFICGHSHILKVISDPVEGLLHMNPGACGHHGFHKVRTLLRFDLYETGIANLEVIELGKRGTFR